jgi:hypothetical protein
VSTVDAPVTHPWRVVAPWWHWPLRHSTDPAYPGAPDDRRKVRVSAPALQKYDTPDLVNTFLRNPQQRLAFEPASDEVWSVTRSRLGALPLRQRTGLRKLFLATHHRHYLVVVSLHCDTAGFPRSSALDVCETGLVVRRRCVDLPGGPLGEMAKAIRKQALARAQRADVQRRLDRLRSGPVRTRLRSATLEARLSSLQQQEQQAATIVAGWRASAGGDGCRLEGWVPLGVDAGQHLVPMPACSGSAPATPLSGRGIWQEVEELPEQLTEAGFPLSALVPDPTDPAHDAAGESIWFGVVPTGSSDLDAEGAPRFDDHSTYEIRCFVRRHRVECPREGTQCSCPVTWSEPSERYRLAGHADLEGTSLRPATVQMPDLTQLRADVARLAPGASAGLRFSSPPSSALSFTSEDTTATRKTGSKGAMTNTDFQVCSFSIPLLTIVAFFVFQLFLPIVVLVFQLWFLLALRFCIPPDVDTAAGLAAALDTVGKADATLTAAVDAELEGADLDAAVQAFQDAVTALENDPAAHLSGALDALLKDTKVSTGGGSPVALSDGLRAARSAAGDGHLDDRTFAAMARGAFAEAATAPPAPQFVKRVERSEVVRP